MPQVNCMDARSIPMSEDIVRNIDLFSSVFKITALLHDHDLLRFIFYVDENGELILEDVDPYAEKVLGFNFSQFIGQKIEDFQPALADTTIPAKYKQAALENINWNLKVTTVEGRCVQRICDVVATPLGNRRVAIFALDIEPNNINNYIDVRPKVTLPAVSAGE